MMKITIEEVTRLEGSHKCKDANCEICAKEKLE